MYERLTKMNRDDAGPDDTAVRGYALRRLAFRTPWGLLALRAVFPGHVRGSVPSGGRPGGPSGGPCGFAGGSATLGRGGVYFGGSCRGARGASSGAVLVALRSLTGGPEHPRAALIVQAVGAYLAGRGAAGRRGRAPAGRKRACPSTGIAPANGERISARQDKCFRAWTY